MVTMRYFAAARAARGVDQEAVQWTGPLDGLLAHVVERTAAEGAGLTPGGLSLAEVFERCTFLVNGARAERSVQLGDGDRLDVLPPFAGG